MSFLKYGCLFGLFTIIFLLLFISYFSYMAHKNRITLSQVMAMIALLGILLSVVGTTWISQTPIPISSESVISGEQMVVSPELPVVQK